MPKKKPKKPKQPLWKGPEVDGVTQSLLSRFLVCRERFRILVVEGLREADSFNHRIEYGSMWHVCEEAFAGCGERWKKYIRNDRQYEWLEPLREYAAQLHQQYPLDQEKIQHWYCVCREQFPVYVDYWRKHPDVKNRTPLLQEQAFNVPYTLPSGRVVRLRGKWDSVDLIGKGRRAGVYLQENKTKGEIHEGQLLKQLSSGFDLQTMLYLVAYQEWHRQFGKQKTGKEWRCNLRGIRYNVVRRPLSGGKGSIRRHKATKTKPEETADEFYGRLWDIIKAKPETYFFRWKVEVTPADLTRFRRECLDPILEQLCQWWDWVTDYSDPFHYVREYSSDRSARRPDSASTPIHWRHPFGVWNSLNEGSSTPLDEYLLNGSTLGLEQTTTLFPELD